MLISGRQFWLWRAVDDEGEILDLLVQRRRDAKAAARLMRKLLKKHGFQSHVANPQSYAFDQNEFRNGSALTLGLGGLVELRKIVASRVAQEAAPHI